jgi:hypothetical protein
MSSLTPQAYAVIEGRHSDPFRYLGPHPPILSDFDL